MCQLYLSIEILERQKQCWKSAASYPWGIMTASYNTALVPRLAVARQKCLPSLHIILRLNYILNLVTWNERISLFLFHIEPTLMPKQEKKDEKEKNNPFRMNLTMKMYMHNISNKRRKVIIKQE